MNLIKKILIFLEKKRFDYLRQENCFIELMYETEKRLAEVAILTKIVNDHKDRLPTPLHKLGSGGGRGQHTIQKFFKKLGNLSGRK